MLLQKVKTGFHWVFARSDDFVNVDAELSDSVLRTSLRDELPSLERVVDTGEILPLGAGICLDVQHPKFGLGVQRGFLGRVRRRLRSSRKNPMDEKWIPI
jgi:hypothetical protein